MPGLRHINTFGAPVLESKINVLRWDLSIVGQLNVENGLGWFIPNQREGFDDLLPERFKHCLAIFRCQGIESIKKSPAAWISAPSPSRPTERSPSVETSTDATLPPKIPIAYLHELSRKTRPLVLPKPALGGLAGQVASPYLVAST